MSTIRTFLTHNSRQFKTAFTAFAVIFALFIAALLLFGSKKYSLFDTVTLPIGFGALGGLLVVLIMVVAGYANWLYKEHYFKKHLKVFIENYRFDIRPYPKSIWAMTMPTLYGSLNSQEIIIELIEEKDLFISFMNEDTPVNNKHGFIYSYKKIKKLGIDNLVNELTGMTRPA